MSMRVRMPNGEVIDNVPDGTTQAELLRRVQLRDNQAMGVNKPADPPPPPSKFGGAVDTVTNVAGGALDVARAAITGTGADIAGGLMGAATLATNAAGLTTDDPVAVIRQWQAKAYQPETEIGKKVTGAIGKAAEATVGRLGRYMGETGFELTGSPLFATISEMMPDAAATILGAKFPGALKDYAMRGAAEIAKDALRNQNRTAAMRTARQNALKVSPAEYGGKVGRAITSASNKAEISREISVENNGRVVDLFKANFDLPEDTPVHRGTFSSVRATLAQPYEQARKLGNITIDAEYMADIYNAGSGFYQLTSDFPEPALLKLEQDIAAHRGTYIRPNWNANSAVNAMNFLRENSADLIRSESAIDRKLGFVQRETAQAIEDRLWRHASSPAVGRPDLAAKFKESRRKGAQLHVWEDAADFDKGYFSPRQIVAQRKMIAGKIDPFTDELKIVADTAGAFPNSFQDIRVGTMPISVFERYMIIGGALGAITEASTGSTEGALISSGIAASGIAGRSAMTSDWWQRAMMKPQTGAPTMMQQGAMQLGPAADTAGAVAGAEAGQ